MEKIALAQLQQQWQLTLDRLGKSSHTIVAYRRAVQHFAIWYTSVYAADLDVALVMPRDIRNWRAHQQTVEAASPATINQRLAGVKQFFRWAVETGLCREDPAYGVPNVGTPERQVKGRKPSDVRRLLAAARQHPRDYAMLEMMVGTGIRVGELLSLCVGDLQFGERSGKVTIRQGKGGRFREVPLTVDVRHALQAYLAQDHPDALNPQAALWIGRSGALTQRSSVLRMLEKYAHLAGIAPVNPHALRHTFATRYLAANPGDVRGLARVLGYANLHMVMIYTEPERDNLLEQMERVDYSI
jgi:site-specific recombinase XerD